MKHIWMVALSLMIALPITPFTMAATPTTEEITNAKLAEKFEGIHQARIDNSSGFPRLMINDKPVLPFIFWFNVGMVRDYVKMFQEPQVKMASKAGVHIYGLLIHYPRAADGINIDFTAAEKTLDTFIAEDPQAVFFLRAWPCPKINWKDWNDVSRDEMMTFDDGTTVGPPFNLTTPDYFVNPLISIASDYFAKSFREETARIVSHYEKSPYAKRMLGYHIGGPDLEMLPPFYTEKGPDYSVASQKKFRLWLAQKYQTDETLRKAWGNSTVTLATAAIPRPDKGRFPLKSVSTGAPIKTFYNIPEEKAWVDYSDYYSDLTASRVIDWAKTVKQASNGRRLNMFCQGYMFEIGTSFGGHYALDKVLSCPEVDVLMSPVSYAVRQLGEPAGFMSPVDSVEARGKLWLSEDDMRTAFIDKNYAHPSWFGPSAFDSLAKDLHDTDAMLGRNLGMTMVHRAGIWWCDLVGAGAFKNEALWGMLKERLKIYSDIYKRRQPYRPEVAVIIDERSRFAVRSDWDMNDWSLGRMRNACDTSGAAIGYYLLEDFINGVVPKCKVYLFCNAFSLSDAQIQKVRARLNRESATAIWTYAAGYLGPKGPSAGRMSTLTGIDVAVSSGTAVSTGTGLLEKEQLGSLNFQPRFVVTDKSAEPLGHYRSDGAVSAARKKTDNFNSIYIGDVGFTSTLLDRLFESAGVHLWTRDGSVTVADETFLMIHSGKAGLKPIAIPKGVKITPITGKIEKHEGDTIFVNFQKGDTLWFKLAQ